MTRPKRATPLHDLSRPEELGAQAPTAGSPGAQKPARREDQCESRKKNRAKKVWLPKQKLDRWEHWCFVNKIDFKDLVENALDLLMQQLEINARLGAQAPNIKINDQVSNDEVTLSLPSSLDLNSGSLGSQLSVEELKARSVLEFYASKTGNGIKPRDRQAYETGHDGLPGVSKLPAHVIRYGIMASMLLCKKRVNAFSYCLGQIHAAAEDGISPQIEEMFQRTFDIRFASKTVPIIDPNNPGQVTPEYAEYAAKLKNAAARQPGLPGTTGDLVQLKPGADS